MHIWITKYWETRGIYAVTRWQNPKGGTRDSAWSTPGPGRGGSAFRKGQWHLTLEEARERVKELRQRRIDSLKRKLAALTELDVSAMGSKDT